MEKPWIFLRALISSAVLAVSLISCGSGGGDDDSSASKTGAPSNITITSLSDQKNQYNEGERVTFDLNTQNTAASIVTYDWEVALIGQGSIEFTGQGTSSISFIAPEIDRDSTVSISVKIGLANGTIFGNDEERTSISIIDINTPAITLISGNAFKLASTPVAAIDLSNIGTEGTWLITEYTREQTTLEGIELVTDIATRRIAYTQQNSNDETTLRGCTSDVSDPLSNVLDARLFTLLRCPSDNIALQYYQDGNNITVERYCEGTLNNATNFQYISSGHRNDLGQLNITFDNYETLDQTTNVCFRTTRLIAQGVDDSNIKLSLSSVTIEAQYQQKAFTALLSMDNLLDGPESYFLGSIFSDFNELTLTNELLPTLSGQKMSAGSIRFDSADRTGQLEGRFNATLSDEDSNDIDTINGTFSFNLEM
ncbi:hypothetical protein [Marinagarivorans algicola]|uniref:hypothetical protein n=1 Tax=Marinagarivorans algicola TaxID=1513270 RepID=UPI0006B4B2C2|nr:hypothetical protein [Marinagarivorans algicola]